MAASISQTSAGTLADAPLSRFLRVTDPGLASVGDALWDLKQALALQCVFLTGCCHRARHLAVRGPGDGKGGSSSAALAAVNGVTVGVVGGGVIGGVVAHALLDAGIPPPAVLMSTRSPRRQKDLAARGVAVVFDNALVAARCQLLILAVLPAQLQDVAKTLRPSPNTLLLSLVGATPLPKIRSLFAAPRAIAGGADTTLPLLLEAQAVVRHEATAGGEPVDTDGLSAGRLPDERVLDLAALGLMNETASVARIVSGLCAVVGDLELPAALASSVAIEALFGELPSGVMSAISREVDEAVEMMAPGYKPPVKEAKKKKAAGFGAFAGGGGSSDDSDSDDLREKFAVTRAQAAFVQRIRGKAPAQEAAEGGLDGEDGEEGGR